MILNHQLNNGIHVIGEEVSGLRSISIGFYIKNGSVDEDIINNGVSHFIEHMLFKGTQNYSAKQLADIMSRMGGRINAYTSKEYVCFYAHVLDEHFNEIVDVLSDMLQHSLFNPEDIEREKDIILEEYAMYEDNPEELILDKIHQDIWINSSYGYNIIGTKDTIKAMNQSILNNYINEKYVGENIVISVVGNMVFDKVVKKLEASLNDIKKGVKTERTNNKDYTPVLDGIKKDIEQAHLVISQPTIDYYRDETYVMNMISTYMGGGLNSRLFQRIREDLGLAYSIYTFVETFKDRGLYTTYAACNPGQIERVYDEIQKEYGDFVKTGINDHELLELKEQIKSNFIIGMESMSSRMAHYGRGLLLMNKIRSMDEIIESIDAVTVIDVQKMIIETFENTQDSVMIVSPDISFIETLKKQR